MRDAFPVYIGLSFAWMSCSPEQSPTTRCIPQDAANPMVKCLLLDSAQNAAPPDVRASPACSLRPNCSRRSSQFSRHDRDTVHGSLWRLPWIKRLDNSWQAAAKVSRVSTPLFLPLMLELRQSFDDHAKINFNKTYSQQHSATLNNIIRLVHTTKAYIN